MHTIDDQYVFSGRLDIDTLEKLYGNDIKKAVEVFHSSLQDIQEEMELSEIYFKNNDLKGLITSSISIQSSVHNVGLTSISDFIQTFEDTCRHAIDTEEIRGIISSIDLFDH